MERAEWERELGGLRQCPGLLITANQCESALRSNFGDALQNIWPPACGLYGDQVTDSFERRLNAQPWAVH